MLKFCPNCEKNVTVKFEGVQNGLPVRGLDGQLIKKSNGEYLLKSINLFTCSECYSTFTGEGQNTMFILNHTIVEKIAASDNPEIISRLDVWLMQWYNSSHGLKSVLLETLAEMYNQVTK